MRASTLKLTDIPTEYAELVAMYPPRPIRDGVDERNVEEIVLTMAGHELTRDQGDYLELLSDLLLKYQNEKYPRKRRVRTPGQRLKYLMEQSGVTPSALAALLGCSQPLVSFILSGRRNLSKENVRKLAAHFRLDAGYFL
ncbi:MAG: type II toxin-antitoxin system HigA family antitoxin [Tepidisphaerales bacterium]